MKIGDEYRYIGETKNPIYTNGAIYKFSGESFGGGILIHNNLMDDHYWDEVTFSENFKKVISPIRTITRKEIVAGQYGIVKVGSSSTHKVMGNVCNIAIGASPNHTLIYTAEELREAAHLLNQIAEVLEENGK